MRLYNTLSKKVEDLQPIQAPDVSVYTCGPTVYDEPHIGNWFTFIRYDLLIRTLKASGLNVKWVLNITDVGHLVSDADEGEDKLETGARREGKSAWEIADFYTKRFIEGIEALNISSPTHLPRATQHIEDQIDLIKTLEQKGFTYSIKDGVYFDTSRFPSYGHFAQLELDELQAGARVDVNPEKRNPSDFALWKFSPTDKKRDMEWDSPWGKGFPGWHIECSAMALKLLGETIDIHAGGIDHIPVHHTNEIAQSEAATDKPFAHYWMHTNHIALEGEKISKSLGNTLSLEDISGKDFSPLDLRYLVMQSHYRSRSQFSWGILEAAKQSYKSLVGQFSWVANSPIVAEQPSEELKDLLTEGKKVLLADLLDDLNTPKALADLHEIADKLAALPLSILDKNEIDNFSAFSDSLLGIPLVKSYTLTDSQTQILRERDEARKQKNWEHADELRSKLTSEGIGLRDTEYGTIWFTL